MSMNPEIKKQWATALRSGNYKQGEYQLKRKDEYCCLGVLCDIYQKEHGQDACWNGNAFATIGEKTDKLTVLPIDIMKWSGLEHERGARVEIENEIAHLTSHNDGAFLSYGGKKSFAQIADAIEEQL